MCPNFGTQGWKRDKISGAVHGHSDGVAPMSGRPWMPLYIADYLGDTQHLTTEEHGAYLLILMAMWRHGMLRNDPTLLSRIAKVSPRRWATIAPNVMPYFAVEEEFIISRRLQKEHEKACSYAKKQSENAKRGVEAKALKRNNPPPANGSAKSEPNASLPQSQSHKEEKEEGASALVVGFQGRVIKLNHADYQRWRQNYPNLELDSELSAHDAFLAGESESDQKRWFVRTATHLRNRNATMKAKPKASVAAVAGDWDAGAVRQLVAREGPKVSEEERQANLAKLAKLKFKAKGV
jgi:uncharacterized protein YdaU (DUF1376 family)